MDAPSAGATTGSSGVGRAGITTGSEARGCPGSESPVFSRNTAAVGAGFCRLGPRDVNLTRRVSPSHGFSARELSGLSLFTLGLEIATPGLGARDMDPIMISAASGMRSRMESLDMLANNLANAGTPGFKTDREFYSLYAAQEALDAAAGGQSPVPSSLPVIERHWTDYAQGTLLSTGNPLDLALSGRGFFVVDGPSGPLYTRNGSFHLSTAGVLTTAEGYPVRSVAGQRIQAQSSAPLEIGRDGQVTQDGVLLGQIAVVDWAPGAIDKFGHNYFQALNRSATPQPVASSLEQGKLEASNVATPESAVRLVSLMRQFEMLQRAVSLTGEMGRRAIEDVARVNS